MTTIIKAIFDSYDDYMASGDARVTSWMFMEGPAPMMILVTTYVLFVKLIGPAWMREKEPFELRYTMVFYNLSCVIANLYLVTEVLKLLLTENKLTICMQVKYSDPDEQRMLELSWMYLMSKFYEFADTVFFVLRKKYSYISTLHVVHHVTVPIAVWIGLRVVLGKYNYFFPLINGMVHVLMYTYYGLAALGPALQKYLWWKKYLTALQIIQFVLVFLYYMLLTVSNCKLSKLSIVLNLFMAGLFFILFADYFQKTYKKKSSQGSNNVRVVSKNNRAHDTAKMNTITNDLFQNPIEKKTG